MSWYSYYKPYVSAAEKAKKLEKQLKKMAKDGFVVAPVKLEGKKIATTFWGKAWCDNLERYSDLENRLPRGRTYVRNGSVVHLQIGSGRVDALVNGSELYTVRATMAPVDPKRWEAIKRDCAGGIDSLVELLQGHLSKAVMDRICEARTGLFPEPAEIKMSCSCPDYADVCKHIAAVIYGIGARLDQEPELLFTLRQVDAKELISSATGAGVGAAAAGSAKVLATDDLSALFGLDMGVAQTPAKKTATAKAPAKKAALKKVARKKPMVVEEVPKRKTAPNKAVVKKSAPKKAVVKKSAEKKAAVKKSARVQVALPEVATVRMKAVPKATVKKSGVKKSAGKKAAVKKGMARKAQAKKAVPQKATANTEAASPKAAGKRGPAGKAAPRGRTVAKTKVAPSKVSRLNEAKTPAVGRGAKKQR